MGKKSSQVAAWLAAPQPCGCLSCDLCEHGDDERDRVVQLTPRPTQAEREQRRLAIALAAERQAAGI
jgi:hypothetical protein